MQRKLVLVGLNHETAPLDLREKAHFAGESLRSALAALRSVEGLEGGVLLSTCNRTELAAVFSESVSGDRHVILEEFLARERGLDPAILRPALYHRFGLEAARHVFRVASSLDSLVLGEPQILGQVKDALEAALAEGAARGLATRLFEKALTAAKRVRTETAVGDGAVSVGHAAVALAQKIFGDLARQKVLVIGAGEMAESVVENLASRGARGLVVSTRNYDNAVALAARHGGAAARFDALDESVARSDIIISSTACPRHILSRARVEEVLRERRNKPLFLIDIAVPRDVDPEVGSLEGVFLYNLDDLKHVAGENRAWREGEARRAERIVDEEVGKFAHYLDALAVDPILRALHEKAEHSRAEELARVRERLGGALTTEHEEALDAMTRALVKKILGDPAETLRAASRNGEGHDLARATRKLFRLEDKP